jgi:hypothetical protein
LYTCSLKNLVSHFKLCNTKQCALIAKINTAKYVKILVH